MLRARGDFPFQPCQDSFALPKGAFEPSTQSNAIQLLLSQLTREFDVCQNALGLTDKEMTRLDECRWPLFAHELRARLRDNTFTLTECVSYYNLVHLATAVHNEATEDDLKQIIWDDRLEQIHGSKGFNMEMCLLEQREHDQVHLEMKVAVQLAAEKEFATLEQEAKNMAQSMAEATKTEHFLCLLSDYKTAADNRVRNEAESYYTECLVQLKAQWDLHVLGDERAMIWEAALKLDLFPSSVVSPSTPKCQRTAPLSKTAALTSATAPPKQGDKWRASMELTCMVSLLTPPLPAHESISPLPTESLPKPIDPQTRGVASSMHNPDNQMMDDLPPFKTAFTQNADDGAAPLSQTPTLTPDDMPAEPLALIGHHLQTMTNIFDAHFTRMEAELQRLAHKVDAPPPPACPIAPPPMHATRSTSTTAATRCPPAEPDTMIIATRPTPVPSDTSLPTRCTTRQPDAPVVKDTPS